jgi:hypothetical protein
MNAKALLTVSGIAVLCAAGVPGQEPAKRPEWDQKKAVQLIKKVVAMEKVGQPWDKIGWLTDVDQAIARSRKEDKPLFVFAFVKGTRGPAAAPC